MRNMQHLHNTYIPAANAEFHLPRIRVVSYFFLPSPASAHAELLQPSSPITSASQIMVSSSKPHHQRKRRRNKRKLHAFLNVEHAFQIFAVCAEILIGDASYARFPLNGILRRALVSAISLAVIVTASYNQGVKGVVARWRSTMIYAGVLIIMINVISSLTVMKLPLCVTVLILIFRDWNYYTNLVDIRNDEVALAEVLWRQFSRTMTRHRPCTIVVITTLMETLLHVEITHALVSHPVRLVSLFILFRPVLATSTSKKVAYWGATTYATAIYELITTEITKALFHWVLRLIKRQLFVTNVITGLRGRWQTPRGGAGHSNDDFSLGNTLQKVDLLILLFEKHKEDSSRQREEINRQREELERQRKKHEEEYERNSDRIFYALADAVKSMLKEMESLKRRMPPAPPESSALEGEARLQTVLQRNQESPRSRRSRISSGLV